MDGRSPPTRKNSAAGGVKAPKRPKVIKSNSLSATGRTKAIKGESSTRGSGRGSRGGRGSASGTRGRKPSLQRQQSLGFVQEQPDGSGVSSIAMTPAPSTAPSTPRDSFLPSVPQTPGEEDEYIKRQDEITDQDFDKIKDGKAEGEEEEEEEEEVGATAESDWKQAQMRSLIYEQHNMLLKEFSPEQTERFEVYRRSALNKANVRKLVSGIFGYACSNNIAICVGGCSKIFIGEIIEKALDVKKEWEDSEGPLSPDHLREAFRRYKQEKSFSFHDYQRRLLRR